MFRKRTTNFVRPSIIRNELDVELTSDSIEKQQVFSKNERRLSQSSCESVMSLEDVSDCDQTMISCNKSDKSSSVINNGSERPSNEKYSQYRETSSSPDVTESNAICLKPTMMATVTGSKTHISYPKDKSVPISRHFSQSPFLIRNKLEYDLESFDGWTLSRCTNVPSASVKNYIRLLD